MTDTSLPLTNPKKRTKFTQIFSWLSYAFSFRIPSDEAKRTSFFKAKFYLSLTLSAIFGAFNLLRIIFWPDVTTTPFIVIAWSSVACVQMIALGLPFLLLAVGQWQLHLSKLPALVAAILSFVIVIEMIIVNQNSSYLPFIEITSYIMLVLGYLFYIDQKNSTDAHAQALLLNRLLVPQARI